MDNVLAFSSSRRSGHCPERVPLPPPRYNTASSGGGSKPYSRTSSFQQSRPAYPEHGNGVTASSTSTSTYGDSAPGPSSTAAYDNQVSASLQLLDNLFSLFGFWKQNISILLLF